MKRGNACEDRPKNVNCAMRESGEEAPAQGQCTAEKITLLPGQSAAEEFNSLAHEVAHSLLHFTERRGETTKRVRETEAEAVAFVICEAIGLKAQNSADYIQLYSGDKETLVSSLECIQRTRTENSRSNCAERIDRQIGGPR